MCKANKKNANKDIIKRDTKVDIKTVSHTKNNTDNGNKIINGRAKFANFLFACLTIANCVDYSNFVFLKKTALDINIIDLNKFPAIFAIFANMTLEKKA